jgi:diaminohydroxyphosphoribosylaminopyrimidine deaminase/5-amino-6-(5-phosphoribosylamino)uracil reductase
MESIVTLNLPEKGTKLSTEQAMLLALSEASKGASFVSPNPMVGAVLLDQQGGFISSGYHQFYGGAHAEVNALQGLRDEDFAGGHLIVTLEPCAHDGKTPSCARAIAKLPLHKVTYGIIDPNPLVAGQGVKIMSDAGIIAEQFSANNKEIADQIRIQLEEVCEAFLWNFRHKKVFVALKMASSLDGQVALKSGESQWITGPESREYVHFLRSCYDAVLVGKGTISFDNPSLNIRHPNIDKKNKVIVIDTEAELLNTCSELNLFQSHEAHNIFWCIAEEFKSEIEQKNPSSKLGPNIIYVKTNIGGHLDLENLLEQIYEVGIRSVMIEGGALTASSFILGELVNRIYVFQAPIILGAGGAKSWTESLRIEKMKDKIQIKNPRYKTFGNDFMITGTFQKK